MKKNLLLLLSICIINLSNAQTAPYDTTTYYGKMGFLFNNLNRTQITTGLLRDYGIDFMNLDNYNGKVLNDTNWVTLPDWRSIYATLYSEQIKTPTNMLYLDTINNLIGRFAQSNLPVTFTCLYYNFNVLDSNAAINNLITIAPNGQLNDVTGRTQSPYLLHSAFAIAPTQQAVAVGSNQLVLHPELFLTNTGKTISNLQIDPKGSGVYQTVSFNTPITVSYDTAGLYIVNFKITYTDGTINYSHTKLVAYGNSSGLVLNYMHRNSEHFKGYGPPYMEEPFIFGTHFPYIPTDFTADKNYLGVAAQGDYTIDLSINNFTGKIKKPLIVISGFDPDAKDDYTGLTYSSDYVNRIDFDYNYSDYYNHTIPLNSTNGLDNADSYDIIYLHWHNGTDYIERNAYLLEKLITLVNTIKTGNGSTEKNVIIGTSMGGLVARYALRDMEQNNVSHDTRLFISDDAPHWGANVPVAYQAMVQYIAPWQIINVGGSFPSYTISYSDMFPDAINGVTIFNSPAAKQMLIQRYNLSGNTLTADNSTHNNFMTELNNMGWPINCRNIVLSNGACNGTLTFPDNNNNFLTINGSQSWSYFGGLLRSLALSIGGIPGVSSIIAPGVPVRNLSLTVQFPLSLVSTSSSLNFDFGAWAVPATGTTLIFKGNVYIKRKILFIANSTSYILKCNVNSTSDMLPLDNAPGSKYDITLFGVNANSVNAQLQSQIGSWVSLNVNQKQFCFVPTVSSLALTNAQQNLRTSLCSNIPCLLSSGVKDYYAPQTNQIHISYTTDNSNWILQQQAASYNCTQVCVAINGDNTICSTSNAYTLSNLPAGIPVAWSLSSNIATVNTPSSSQTTLSRFKNLNGAVVLTANIANGCSSNNVFTKSVQVGTLPVPTYVSADRGIVHNGDIFVHNTIYLFSSDGDTWYAPSTTIISGQGTNQLTDRVPDVPSPTSPNLNFTMQVSKNNACGTSNPLILTLAVTAANTLQGRPAEGSQLTEVQVFPNPAHTMLTINIPPDSLNNVTANIIMHDITGKEVKSFVTVNQNNTINIEGLANGTYTVEIISGKKRIVRQIVKY